MKTKASLSNLGILAIVAGVMLFLAPFYYFDRMDLARPSLASAAAIGCSIATYWKVRTRPWFWIAISVVVSLHVYAVLRVPWTDDRVSPYVLATAAFIDYGITVALIKIIEIVCRSSEEAEKQRSKPLS